MTDSKTTTDHKTIQRWAEERKGVPSKVAESGAVSCVLISVSGKKALRRFRGTTFSRFLTNESWLSFIRKRLPMEK
ncbi:hypothetical protein FHS21_006156 [Phyllobacterium trifolii]|uniref:Uncharacterized protein n=1 Tax=Phyllobacterium trifolii TaxID=300193 RepID=A0A839ULY8_9HYPH|nr:hypothetical protein [Phyllobacterium trifolii]